MAAALGKTVLVKDYRYNGFDRPGNPWDAEEFAAMTIKVHDPNTIDVVVFRPNQQPTKTGIVHESVATAPTDGHSSWMTWRDLPA